VIDDVTTHIWNRACDPDADSDSLRARDRALRDVVALHSLVMNGGLAHALEVLGATSVTRAADGFMYFGRSDVARLLADSASLMDGQIQRLDGLESKYNAVVDDTTLDEAFRGQLSRCPADFAPITER
jgi:hypothetical protein